jgi:hypothetical protein
MNPRNPRSSRAFCLMILLACAMSVHAQDAASLRLDPAVQIDAVDGDRSRSLLPLGPLVKRVLPITPGSHVLDVCYDNSSTSSAGTYLFYTTSKCDAPKQVRFEAKAGRLYRVKLELGPTWKTWVADVTAEESGLSAIEPRHKGEGKTVLLLRISPANSRVGLAGGDVDQIWFVPGVFGAMPMKGDGKDGFISRKISGGATVGTILSWIPKNDSLLNTHSAGPCGETRIPVVEDAPGGVVLYLGEFDYQVTAEGGQVLEVRQEGIDAAREYLRKTEPKLADKVQLATIRWMRVPVPCSGDPRGVLRNATSGITPDGASAGSTS